MSWRHRCGAHSTSAECLPEHPAVVKLLLQAAWWRGQSCLPPLGKAGCLGSCFLQLQYKTERDDAVTCRQELMWHDSVLVCGICECLDAIKIFLNGSLVQGRWCTIDEMLEVIQSYLLNLMCHFNGTSLLFLWCFNSLS